MAPPYSAVYAYLAYLIISVIRAPAVLLHGRFWAEEGSMYWSHARSSPPIESLFFSPGGGYFNLYANVATLTATLVNERLAPLVTAWLSLLLAGISGLLIVKCPLTVELSIRWRFFLASGLVFMPALTEPDIFANSIQAQVWFGVIAAALLLVDFGRLPWNFVFLCSPFVLLLALSGVHASLIGVVLFAFTVVSGIHINESGHLRCRCEAKALVVSLVLVAGFVVQSAIFFLNRADLGSDPTHVRGQIRSLSAFLIFVASNLGTLFSGRMTTESILQSSHQLSFAAVGAGTIFWIVLVSVRRRSSFRDIQLSNGNQVLAELSVVFQGPKLRLFVTYLVTASVTLFGYVSPIPNARYQSIPSAVLFCLLTILVATSAKRVYPAVFVAVVAFSSLIGLRFDPWVFLNCRTPCISWPDQVEEARLGRRERYVFWPLHSSPAFEAPTNPPADWCDNFNALESWSCDD